MFASNQQVVFIDNHFFFLASFPIHFCAERGVCVPPRTDDDFLIRFLRARYFKLEHAYNLVCIIVIFKSSLVTLKCLVLKYESTANKFFIRIVMEQRL